MRIHELVVIAGFAAAILLVGWLVRHRVPTPTPCARTVIMHPGDSVNDSGVFVHASGRREVMPANTCYYTGRRP